jgi:hypothetical protein
MPSEYEPHLGTAHDSVDLARRAWLDWNGFAATQKTASAVNGFVDEEAVDSVLYRPSLDVTEGQSFESQIILSPALQCSTFISGGKH